MKNKNFNTPLAPLGIIGMPGCEGKAEAIDEYVVQWLDEQSRSPSSHKINAVCPRFATGEGKGIIKESVRGLDLFIISDCFNYGVTFKMYGKEVPMSPDDHYQDLKRIIGSVGGKAHRITVIMPMLYEGRQHRRFGRESLDCAVALQELMSMGVDNIITFDAHDARVQNAIPLDGFDNILPYYQMTKALIREVPDIEFSNDKLMVISPDEGGMSRAMYYASMFGVDLGMFYKRRDYSKIVNGSNPILSHQFLGSSVEGKDLIIVDDIISTGGSMMDTSKQLKDMGANRIFIFSTFGLFCDGFEKFDRAYEGGFTDKIFSTNLIYCPDELSERPWWVEVNMNKYLATLILTLNYNSSISHLLDPVHKIKRLIRNKPTALSDD